MYTLRRISSNGIEMNSALGKSYTVVNRFVSYEEFRQDFAVVFGKPHVADMDENADSDTKSVYAFVGTENGDKIYPLYSKQQAYIMTESGATFSNLTLKD